MVEALQAWIFLIPGFPLAMGILQWLGMGLFRWSLPSRSLFFLGCISSVCSFVLSLLSVIGLVSFPPAERAVIVEGFTWFAAGRFGVEVALLLDPLSVVMASAVSGLSLLLHWHVAVRNDPDESRESELPRFFAAANLLIGAVLLAILSENFLMLFLGWQLSTIAVVFLIGGQYEKELPAKVAGRALFIGWAGDGAMLFSLLFLAMTTLSVGEIGSSFHILGSALPSVVDTFPLQANGVGLGLVLAAMTRLLMLPLFEKKDFELLRNIEAWPLLPALSGMLAVFILGRFFAIIETPLASFVLVWMGGLLACIAALQSTRISSIRGILALIFVSQFSIALMVIGLHGTSAGIFCFVIQSFALSGLGISFIVISDALGGEDRFSAVHCMWTAMHRIKWPVLVLTASIVGFPFLAGFFAWDAAMVALSGPYPLWGNGILVGLVLLTVFSTSFALARLYIGVFHGYSRASLQHVVREADWWRLSPVLGLAGIALLAGLVGPRSAVNPFPVSAEASNSFENFLKPTLGTTPYPTFDNLLRIPYQWSYIVLLGIVTAWLFYQRYPKWRTAFHSFVSPAMDWFFRPIKRSENAFVHPRRCVPEGREGMMRAFFDRSELVLDKSLKVLLHRIERAEVSTSQMMFWLLLGVVGLVAYGVIRP